MLEEIWRLDLEGWETLNILKQCPVVAMAGHFNLKGELADFTNIRCVQTGIKAMVFEVSQKREAIFRGERMMLLVFNATFQVGLENSGQPLILHGFSVEKDASVFFFSLVPLSHQFDSIHRIIPYFT